MPAPILSRHGPPATFPAHHRRVRGGDLSLVPGLIPLILLWQFASRGLSPALAERDRLARADPAVEAGYDDARQAFEELDAEARAWQDPVYQERRRRLRAMEPPTGPKPGSHKQT
ncbi:MAG: hypothetical protein R3F17_00020 [Planctomycetota bacterium]